MVIKDEEGHEVRDLIGPFDEGSNVKLRCEARGGNPPPDLKWLRGGKVLSATYEVSTPSPAHAGHAVFEVPHKEGDASSNETQSMDAMSFETTAISDLLVLELSRSDLFSVLTCSASNTNLSSPVSTIVSIDVNCEFKIFERNHNANFISELL